MLIAPSVDDVKVVVHTSGLAVGAFAAAMAALAVVGVLLREPNAATAIVIGAAPGVVAGIAARRVRARRHHLTWTLGMVAATTTWVACALLASIPLWLSGHYVGWYHALFDALSGVTNTGLTLVADLDHLPRTVVLLRSMLEVAGGFAFLVVGATLLSARTAMASSLASGDVRSDRILPRTSGALRHARLLLAGLFGAGVVTVGIAMAVAGLPLASVPWHAVSVAAAAATTGGFAPHADGMAYYHSALVEGVAVVLMLGAATSVAVWIAASRRRHRAILRDLDARIFGLVVLLAVAGTIVGLARAGTFVDVLPMTRHGVFLAVAAATTTGLSTVDPVVLVSDYGAIAPAVMVAAMTIGGMVGSMASGLGARRTGLLARGVIGDVRRLLRPTGSVTRESWWRMGFREPLDDAHVRGAATMALLVLGAIQVGAMVLLWTDPLIDLRIAVFTAASTVSNTGLDMPSMRPDAGLLVTATHGVLMLMGRLHWFGVFAAAGFAVALVGGHR